MRFISLFTVISCISFTLACGGGNEDTSTDNALCDPGSTQICVGSGVCEGVQVCNLNGSAWGECDCGTSDNTGGEAGSLGEGGAETGGSAEPTGGSSPETGGSEPETGGSTGGEPETGGTVETGGTTGGTDEPTGGTEPETGGTETGGSAEAGANTGGNSAGAGTGGEPCVPVYDRTDPELSCQLKAMELAGVTIEDLQGGAEMPDACGYIDDGCGNPINCNGCAEHKGCGTGEVTFNGEDENDDGWIDVVFHDDFTVNNQIPGLCQGGCVGVFNGWGSTYIVCSTVTLEQPDPAQIQWTAAPPPYEITVCYDDTDDFGEGAKGHQLWSCDINSPE